MPVSDLRAWRPLTYSCKDTPETRKQILQHDSAYDSLANGSKVIIQDNCPAPKQDKTS